jgi:carbonic anhydrase
MNAANSTTDSNVPARDALARLREGNQRYVEGRSSVVSDPATRAALAQGQRPFAIILSCSDSRVPSELVFDQGLGELFVVRVAGNVVAPSLVGSVEFAAATFGTRLVVVMGHSRCGAIKATLDEKLQAKPVPSDNIRDIVERCRASVETVVSVANGKLSPDELLAQAVRANVRSSCSHLRHGSPLLERLARDEGLLIAGAEYELESGLVDFFDVP